MIKIIKYVMLDILKNRIVLSYTLFLLVISLSVFNLEDNATKGLLSLLNIILIIIPLISIVFSSIYIYHSAEFIELLVSQPLKRTSLLLSVFTGLCLSLLIALMAGVGIPILIYSPTTAGMELIGVGLVLTGVFVSLALLASVMTRDKARGIGVAILLWFYFTVIYDGIVLFLLFQFSDYPMEKTTIGLSSLNPIDLARIVILLKLDISAMMGYTGAVFKDFFGGIGGMLYTLLILLMWFAIPSWWAVRIFKRKDL
jgi:Cu-processing system permease protein